MHPQSNGDFMINDIFNQFAKTLTNLAVILDKAQKNADARKFDVGILLQSRLAPDMFHLVRQVQIATDTAKFGVAKLCGVDAPKWEDNETTLADLKARIHKAIDYIQSATPAQFSGWETRKTLNPRREGKYLPGDEYLYQYVIPNFFFHVTTAYAILRHNGVDIGKNDFLGEIQYRPL
jgi:hypothetical protein